MKTFKQFLLETPNSIKYLRAREKFPKVTNKVRKNYEKIGGSDFRTNPGVSYELKKHYRYNKDQRDAISSYTIYANNFNNYVSKKITKPGVTTKNPFDYRDKHISDAIKAHKTPKDLYVYHGGDHLAELLKKKPNKFGEHIIHNKRYVSTSLDHPIAAHFGDPQYNKRNRKEYHHVLKIHIPKGSHAAYVKPELTLYPYEEEFILHRGHKIAVNSKPTFDNKRGLVTWHGTLIHDGIKDTIKN